jgi:hypothetical protein
MQLTCVRLPDCFQIITMPGPSTRRSQAAPGMSESGHYASNSANLIGAPMTSAAGAFSSASLAFALIGLRGWLNAAVIAAQSRSDPGSDAVADFASAEGWRSRPLRH